MAEYARRINSNVSIVPTTIDTGKYFPVRRVNPKTLTIGWTGSHSTIEYLNLLRNVFLRLSQKVAFRLRVIGVRDFRMEGVDCEVMPWRSGTEVEDLSTIDIGVMPLSDNEWARGKCGCKALQYMGLGIPTVCSAVGANLDIILDGQNGFLVRSEDEWVERLLRLLQSPDLRRRLGHAGRKTVESHYSAVVQAPRVAEIFRSALMGSLNIKELASETV